MVFFQRKAKVIRLMFLWIERERAFYIANHTIEFAIRQKNAFSLLIKSKGGKS